MNDLRRYARQMILTDVGESGQKRLLSANVTVVGCGALGSVISNHLVRSGVGSVTIVDRDRIELNNLQRQTLFDEEDIEQHRFKADAASAKLRRINSQVNVRSSVLEVDRNNVEDVINGADIVMDGTDNYETRLLINEACVKRNIPWVYTGVVSTRGMTMLIIPHQSFCLRCFMSDGPLHTCQSIGVLSAAVDVIGSFAVTEAMKWLLGCHEHPLNRLIYVDVWHSDLRRIEMRKSEQICPVCEGGRYDLLSSSPQPA